MGASSTTTLVCGFLVKASEILDDVYRFNEDTGVKYKKSVPSGRWIMRSGFTVIGEFESSDDFCSGEIVEGLTVGRAGNCDAIESIWLGVPLADSCAFEYCDYVTEVDVQVPIAVKSFGEKYGLEPKFFFTILEN